MRKHFLLISLFCMTFFLCSCGNDIKLITEESEYIGSCETSADADESDGADIGADADESDKSDGGADADESQQIAVFVCGAVNNPGVYHLKRDSLVMDALDASGGFVEDAATDYVNLAETLSDGIKIYFPYKDEVTPEKISNEINDMNSDNVTSDASCTDDKADTTININSATKDELMTLPGIGESKADAIISYRNDNGSFSSLEEIKNIRGIKDGVYNKIRDYIKLN